MTNDNDTFNLYKFDRGAMVHFQMKCYSLIILQNREPFKRQIFRSLYCNLLRMLAVNSIIFLHREIS